MAVGQKRMRNIQRYTIFASSLSCEIQSRPPGCVASISHIAVEDGRLSSFVKRTFFGNGMRATPLLSWDTDTATLALIVAASGSHLLCPSDWANARFTYIEG